MGTWVSPPLDMEAFRPPPDGFSTAAAAAAAVAAAAAASPDLSTAISAEPSAAAMPVSATPAVTNIARAQEDVGDTPRKAGGEGASSSDRPPPTPALPPAKNPAPVECTANGKRSRAAFEGGGSGMGGDRVTQEDNSLGKWAAWQQQQQQQQQQGGGGAGFGASAHESSGVAELVADVLAAGPEAAARPEATGVADHVSTVGVDAVARAPHLGDGIRSPSAPLAAPVAPTYESFSETSLLAEGGGATTLEPRTEPATEASPWPTLVRTTMAAAGLWDTVVHSPAAPAAFSAPGVEPRLAHVPAAADGAASRPSLLPLPAASLAVTTGPRPSPLLISTSGSTSSSVIVSNGSIGGSGGESGNTSPPLPSGAPPQVVGAAQGCAARDGRHLFPAVGLAGPIAPPLPPPPPPPPPASSLPFFSSSAVAEVDDGGKPPNVDTDFLRQMYWIPAPTSLLGPSATPDRSQVAPAGDALPPRPSFAAAAATASVAALLEQQLHQHHQKPSTPLPAPPVEPGDIDVGIEHRHADTPTHPVPAAGPPYGDGGGGTTNRATPGNSRHGRARAPGEPPSRAPQPPPLLRPDDVVQNPCPPLQRTEASTPVGGSDGRGGGGGSGGAHRQRRRTCGEEGCQRRPLFGAEGTRTARFCASHKPDGFVNVNCRRCEVEGCKRQPSFGMMPAPAPPAPSLAPPEGSAGQDTLGVASNAGGGARAVPAATTRAAVASRCASHRSEGMVNLSAPKCLALAPPGYCPVVPSFGKPGAKRPTACSAHRKQGDVDVVTRRCHREGCLHRPVFGYLPREPGGRGGEEAGREKARYCNAHKLDGMVNIFAARCVAQKSCRELATFGPPGVRRPTHCAKHRAEQHEKVTTYHS